jgi:hypothetical protein
MIDGIVFRKRGRPLKHPHPVTEAIRAPDEEPPKELSEDERTRLLYRLRIWRDVEIENETAVLKRLAGWNKPKTQTEI